ncbi:NlpC/P60 family protein [Pseudoclavibacter sp. RFBB5]|uniref:NlpC/P60 family protein n=1 Tax=Pseudoclavibacter sp. RFBB5 TaxID=2080574 RepID=UPI0015E23601|nr:NlpC/P60 family protein [Pseudoclavibacter sp. RFBB5]
MSTSSTPRTDSTKVLTRREARAIERQTGVRPAAAPAAVTGVSAPVIDASIAELSATETSRPDATAASVHDTARIERNQHGSLVSVLPVAPAVDRAAFQAAEQADDAPSADVTPISEAFTGRAVSIRAAKPAALVARGRRRTAASFAAAATVAAAATAGIVVPAAVADGKSEVQSQANLVAATAPDATAAPADTTTTPAAEAAPAEEVALVAAPEVAVDRTDSTVVSISSDDLAAVAETPTPTPTPDETQEPEAESSTSSSTSSGGGTSSQTSTTSSSPSSSGASSSGSGNVDTSSLIAAAHSYVGSYFPACTDLTKAVYATQGISLSGSVSNQIAGARQTSSPQPGDLVVQPGAHIGIYAGDGMVIDSPGYGGKVVQYRSIWWSNPVYYTFN